MHRIILDEPLSQAAVWSRTFAFFALIVALFGVLLARKGLDPTAAVAIEGGAAAIALLAILLAFAAMVVIWRTGYRGTARLLVALLISAGVLAYPAYLIERNRRIPAIYDVSTDPDDPPGFSYAAAAVSGRNGNTPNRPSPTSLDAQRRLYPDLQSIVVDEEPQEAFKEILKIVTARRWKILEASPPTGRPGHPIAGHIDAVATSTVMGFPADIAIRVRQSDNQTRVDIRSVSRTRWHEPDSDALRVQALVSDIEDEIGGDK